jgi:hypothetical protein
MMVPAADFSYLCTVILEDTRDNGYKTCRLFCMPVLLYP